MTGMEFTIAVLIAFLWIMGARLTLLRMTCAALDDDQRYDNFRRHRKFYVVLTAIAWIPINGYWLWQKFGGRT